MMLERKEPIHSVVFFDTGWEFPQMLDHINLLEKKTGIEIVRLKPEHQFDELLIKYNWPWMQGRWCTREKIRIILKYCKNHDGVELIGIAANEKHRTESKEFKGRNCRFPLVEWGITEQDALEYCYLNGYHWAGVYDHFDRVSCFCCPLKGSPNAWRKIRKHYPKQWEHMLEMDASIENNRGFYGYKTVHDLDKRFAEEDRQMRLFNE